MIKLSCPQVAGNLPIPRRFVQVEHPVAKLGKFLFRQAPNFSRSSKSCSAGGISFAEYDFPVNDAAAIMMPPWLSI